VFEYCYAFIQFYLEDAHYLERTAPWIERVGLTRIKNQLVEDEQNRKALVERFHISQEYVKTDPWAERATGGMEQHQFVELKRLG
jgi:nitrite reductase (NADH) large subunit